MSPGCQVMRKARRRWREKWMVCEWKRMRREHLRPNEKQLWCRSAVPCQAPIFQYILGSNWLVLLLPPQVYMCVAITPPPRAWQWRCAVREGDQGTMPWRLVRWCWPTKARAALTNLTRWVVSIRWGDDIYVSFFCVMKLKGRAGAVCFVVPLL